MHVSRWYSRDMPRHELTKQQQQRVVPLMVRALTTRTQAELALKIGIKTHGQVSRAAKDGTLSRMSALLLCRLLDEDPAIVGLGDLGCPLAATPGWEEASADLDETSKAIVGHTVPPTRLSRVTATSVHLYLAAWRAAPSRQRDDDPAPESTRRATGEPGPEPTKPVVPFGVAGARAARKRDRQAT
jgi:hypothetical protein